MTRDVWQPPRPSLPDQQTEHAVTTRRVPDCLTLRLGDPLGHELDEVFAIGADHAQRAVLRVDKLTGRMHYPAKDVGQLKVRGDCHHGVKKRGQTLLGPVRSLLTTAQLVELRDRVERESDRPSGCRSFTAGVGLHLVESRANRVN